MISWQFPEWEKAIKANYSRIMKFLQAQMQTNRRMLFNASGNYSGHQGWKGLAFRSGMPLLKSGARGLSGSIGPANDGLNPIRGIGSILEINGETATIGTNLKYARLMNDGTAKMPGGVLRAKNGGVLRIPLPAGKAATAAVKSLKGVQRQKKSEGKGSENVIFRKFVRIPARPFDEITKQDEAEFSQALSNQVAKILELA